MVKYFLAGTSLQNLEKEIMRPPTRIEENNPFEKVAWKMYLNGAHLQRLRELPFDLYKNSAYAASIYILAADMALWKRAACAIGDGRISFKRINQTNADLFARLLLDIARKLYWSKTSPRPETLCSRELMDWDLYRLCKTACNIRRYGFPKEAI